VEGECASVFTLGERKGRRKVNGGGGEEKLGASPDLSHGNEKRKKRKERG